MARSFCVFFSQSNPFPLGIHSVFGFYASPDREDGAESLNPKMARLIDMQTICWGFPKGTSLTDSGEARGTKENRFLLPLRAPSLGKSLDFKSWNAAGNACGGKAFKRPEKKNVHPSGNFHRHGLPVHFLLLLSFLLLLLLFPVFVVVVIVA